MFSEPYESSDTALIRFIWDADTVSEMPQNYQGEEKGLVQFESHTRLVTTRLIG